MVEQRKPDRMGKPSKFLHFELIEPDDIKLTDEDVESDLLVNKGSALFLNRFTVRRIFEVLREERILARLKDAGFRSPVIAFSNPDTNHHRLAITDQSLNDEQVLGELHVRVARFRPERGFVAGVEIGDQQFLHIEWLAMQNPLAEFNEERPRLPGQRHPGLGIGREVVNVLVRVARVMDLDGIINCPEYYHNAAIYVEVFKYYDPRFQGRVLAIKRDLAFEPLNRVSDAVDRGYLEDALTGEPVPWSTQEQILPLSGRAIRYFGAEPYRDQVLEVFTNSRFRINWEAYMADPDRIELDD